MNQTRPELSAIVIAYLGMAFLPDLMKTLMTDLASLEAEVIVVDNGSTDATESWLREQYSQVRLIENGANFGFTRAVNIGLQAARGDYVYLLNQDLRIRPGSTLALMERLRSDPAVGMIGPAFYGFEGDLQHSARAFPTYRHVWYETFGLSLLFPRHREFSHWRLGWFDHRAEMFVDQPMGAAMMLPRRVIDEVGMFDESFPIFFSDVDYCKRLELAGYARLYFPEAEVEHYVGSSTSRRPFLHRTKSHFSMYRYLRKYSRWYGRLGLWCCGVLLLFGLMPSFLRLLVSRKR